MYFFYGLEIENWEPMMMKTTHCRLGSRGGLFRTVSRSGLGEGFPQRGQHLDHVDPANMKMMTRKKNIGIAEKYGP